MARERYENVVIRIASASSFLRKIIFFYLTITITIDRSIKQTELKQCEVVLDYLITDAETAQKSMENQNLSFSVTLQGSRCFKVLKFAKQREPVLKSKKNRAFFSLDFSFFLALYVMIFNLTPCP